MKSIEEGKQPKDEGHSQSNKAPEHSGSRKNETKITNQAQKAQNRANSKTLQEWRDCKAATGARKKLARAKQKQHAPIGPTVGLKSAPVEFLSQKQKKNYSRIRSMYTKQTKKQKNGKRTQPRRLTKQGKS